MATKGNEVPAPEADAEPVTVQATDIELAPPPVQTARAVESTRDARRVKGVSVARLVRENSKYGRVSTQEV